jgi:UDP-glucose 4-epimerase
MPLSPYAAAKLAGEVYCRGFTRVYGLETVALRFFNVFGPRQDPGSEYSAVIPLFARRMIHGERPTIFGDGLQSRDFTYVANAVQACILAAEEGADAAGESMNVGCGERITLLDLVEELNDLLGTDHEPLFAPGRVGDVRHSLASIDKAERLIGYKPLIHIREGLDQTIAWLEAMEREPAS